MRWLLVLAALAGCRTRTSDTELYLQAMEVPPERATDVCARISIPSMRGECQTHNAAAVAREGDIDLAWQLCEKIDDQVWQEECWFLTTDEAEVIGEDAVTACRRTGRYRTNCLGHAIGREVETTEKKHDGVGREPELEKAVGDVVARYKPNAPDDQRQVTVDRIVAQILSKRWGDGPFDASKCGNAKPEHCRLAYRMRLDAAPPEIPIERLCRDGVTLEGVTAARAPYWEPGSEADAQLVWKQLCDDLASGAVRRDATTSMGVPPRPPEGTMPGDRVHD